MGSWSEGCNLSGIEISEKEYAYVMLIARNDGSFNDGASMFYKPVSTLIRGYYNDYGQLCVEDNEDMIKIFNEITGLDLKNGDQFTGSNLNEGVYRWWIREDIFQQLEELEDDLPWVWLPNKERVEAKTVGKGADIWAAHMLGKIIEMEITDNLDFASALMHLTSIFRDTSLIDLELLIQKDRPEARLKAHRDVKFLTACMTELRKPFAPGESIGPQHGGDQNSILLAKSIISIQKKRKKRFDW